MNKLAKLSLLVLTSLLLLSCSKNDNSDSSNTAAENNKIISFKINGVEGTIHDPVGTLPREIHHNITITLPYATNIAALTPAIQLSEGATVSPQIGTAVDFTNAVTYTVKNIQGEQRAYTVKVSTAQPKYKIGSFYPDSNNPSTATGVVYYVDATGEHGRAIGLDETSGLAWSTVTETTNTTDDNGVQNTTWVKNNKNINSYLAFKYCINKGEGWFLPSYKEMGTILELAKSTINPQLEKVTGATLLDVSANFSEYAPYYLSSTETNSNQAQSVNKYSSGSGSLFHSKLNTDKRIRAAFTF